MKYHQFDHDLILISLSFISTFIFDLFLILIFYHFGLCLGSAILHRRVKYWNTRVNSLTIGLRLYSLRIQLILVRVSPLVYGTLKSPLITISRLLRVLLQLLSHISLTISCIRKLVFTMTRQSVYQRTEEDHSHLLTISKFIAFTR